MNVKLNLINNERTAILGIFPPFEPYTNKEELLEGIKNYVENHQTLWREKISLPKDQIESSRKHYNKLRDAFVSCGGNLTGLPKKIKILEDNN